MLVETDRIIPITKLQKELTQTVRELSETGEPVYILKNNNMEAVMVSFSEYEYLTNLEEMFSAVCLPAQGCLLPRHFQQRLWEPL